MKTSFLLLFLLLGIMTVTLTSADDDEGEAMENDSEEPTTETTAPPGPPTSKAPTLPVVVYTGPYKPYPPTTKRPTVFRYGHYAAEKRRRWCFQCVGERHARRQNPDIKSCTAMRKVKRDVIAKLGHHNQKEINAAWQIEGFGQLCPVGIRDCFNYFPKEKLIVGLEARGCGGGVKPDFDWGGTNAGKLDIIGVILDAEPGEGCSTDKLVTSGIEVEYQNCLCETTKDIDKGTAGFCNKGAEGQRAWSFLSLLGVGSIVIILSILFN